MSAWDRAFKNPAHLATPSLDARGALIEFVVHNAMRPWWRHVVELGPARPHDRSAGPLGRPDHEPRGKWLLPACDFLGEFFSSHVKPVFWRLHGWVDQRIDDRFAAREALHRGEVVAAEVGGIPWFAEGPGVANRAPWPGRWTRRAGTCISTRRRCAGSSGSSTARRARTNARASGRDRRHSPRWCRGTGRRVRHSRERCGGPGTAALRRHGAKRANRHDAPGAADGRETRRGAAGKPAATDRPRRRGEG
ncbi:hypothetical protein [Methylobacterium durans]|uniref:hypothetical protein n=1 Tax=Methylobacterium durans TaxID=2202825 RepID=UPI0013A55314|nr:hypothetical protein [Methylobacterium durans]